jgi:hypothetical protein
MISQYFTSSVAPFDKNRLIELYRFFGVGEAMSFWKRGSFRSGSNIGSSRSSAGVSGPEASAPAYGIESSFCKAAMARSGSPICAATPGQDLDRNGTSHRVFFDRQRGHGPFRQSQRGGFVARAHIGKREISNEEIIVRLFFEKRFQFAARLAPACLGGGMVAGDGLLTSPQLAVLLFGLLRMRVTN